MSDLPLECKQITLGSETIILDPKKLLINETNLSQFMDELGVWYNYFTQKTAEMEHYWSLCETEYEEAYSFAFSKAKEDGKSDKLSEACSKCDPAVAEARKKADTAKLHLQELKAHVRAWDKAHECGQNRGHTLRKEMDKLNPDIYKQIDDLFDRNG